MKILPFAQELNTTIGGSIAAPKQPGTTQSFSTELAANIKEVNSLQNVADGAIEQGALEGAKDIHETMIKLEEADMSLRLMTKVRNKAIDAYHEVMRMQF